jgi:hydroxyethylthiazole kinase
MLVTASNLKTAIAQFKQCKPLIHNITNMVAMNPCANILLALGVSPL